MRQSDSLPQSKPASFAMRYALSPAPGSAETLTAAGDVAADLFSFSTANNGSDADGYAAWQEQQRQVKQAIERKWGVPLGCRVRLQLITQGQPIEGIVRLADDDIQNPGAKDRFLRIQDIRFSPREIETLARL